MGKKDKSHGNVRSTRVQVRGLKIKPHIYAYVCVPSRIRPRTTRVHPAETAYIIRGRTQDVSGSYTGSKFNRIHRVHRVYRVQRTHPHTLLHDLSFLPMLLGTGGQGRNSRINVCGVCCNVC